MTLSKFARALVLAAAAILAAMPPAAFAQSYPSRPIRLIVGLAPGSAVDILGRQYAQKLSEILNTPVYVENKPGAAQLTAIRALQQAPADGYTLYMAIGSALSQGPGIRKDLPYDPLKAFSFVAQVGTVAGMIYAHGDVPVNNVAELIAYAKAHPGKLSYGSAGVGTAGHLCAEYFMFLTGAKLYHVPYRSDPEAAREAAAGTINLAFTVGRAGAPLAESGKLKPIMVIGSRRVSYFPDVGTAAEAHVPGLEGIGPFSYYGLVGPAGLPPEIVDKLNRAVNQATTSPDEAANLKSQYIDSITGTPQDFRGFVEKEIGKWHKLGEHVKIEL